MPTNEVLDETDSITNNEVVEISDEQFFETLKSTISLLEDFTSAPLDSESVLTATVINKNYKLFRLSLQANENGILLNNILVKDLDSFLKTGFKLTGEPLGIFTCIDKLFSMSKAQFEENTDLKTASDLYKNQMRRNGKSLRFGLNNINWA